MPATVSDPVLRATDLTKRYDGRAALQGVSLVLHPGELLAVIGPNGAGKTTLLQILAGVTPPDDGEFSLHAGATGWVPQRPALYAKLTVAENLRLFARLERVADPEAAVAAMLEQTGLSERAADPVSSLSGGNQQRVNIAIGLLGSPPVLLLDEPSASLDARQRERLWQFVAGLSAAGRSIIYSTHDLFEVERHAERVLVLDEGRLRFTGTPAELERAAGSSSTGVEAAFLRLLRERS